MILFGEGAEPRPAGPVTTVLIAAALLFGAAAAHYTAKLNRIKKAEISRTANGQMDADNVKKRYRRTVWKALLIMYLLGFCAFVSTCIGI